MLRSSAFVLPMKIISQYVNRVHNPCELANKSRQLGLLFNFEFSVGNFELTRVMDPIYML